MEAEQMAAIRAAVVKNHGGFAQADDAAVLRLWQALEESTQQRYLAASQEKDEGGNVSTGP